MKKVTLLSLIAVMLFTSCASIFTGSKRKVLFESNPNGAKVYVNGFEKGITPVQIKVEADDRVDFRLENYKERVVVMDSNFNLVSILNGLSIIGWGVDALTGSLKRVDTKYVKVDLESAATAANFLEKGKIQSVNINTDEQIVETIIVLD
ncbi:PEGA domain-containing protein [Leeuwenhoekiella sp. NPDC079379]|uniref:PEGA domain-containing protein n=1 Tax=Leeuwenhoekiella sp. NPDC079379 TaxID=3364122 RepID=UPI00276597E9|nr:PEGA domain-containing protein [Leeuwenhoekiella sp.]